MKPKVFILDDDPEFNQMIIHVLAKLGIEAIAFSAADLFFSEINRAPPALCIVDLNLGPPRSGLGVLEKIRKRVGNQIPVFIASSENDYLVIAHAVESGATDYLIKPLDRQLLTAKLMNQLSSRELNEASWDFDPSREGQQSCTLRSDMEVTEVDELGLKIQLSHLTPKGTPLLLEGAWIEELTGSPKPRLVTVTSTWVSPDTGLYGAYVEFDLTDDQLIASIRSWITKTKPTMST